eukprot:354574-Chlamydomonas_euryale.AAC.5
MLWPPQQQPYRLHMPCLCGLHQGEAVVEVGPGRSLSAAPPQQPFHRGSVPGTRCEPSEHSSA